MAGFLLTGVPNWTGAPRDCRIELTRAGPHRSISPADPLGKAASSKAIRRI